MQEFHEQNNNTLVCFPPLLFIVSYSCIVIGKEPTDNHTYFGADKINLISVKVKF